MHDVIHFAYLINLIRNTYYHPLAGVPTGKGSTAIIRMRTRNVHTYKWLIVKAACLSISVDAALDI